MTGDADPMMSFPSGTVFTSFSVIRNVSKEKITVTPKFYWMQGGAAKSARATPFQLNPNETRVLDTQSILATAKLKNYSGSANLILDIQGKPNSFLFSRRERPSNQNVCSGGAQSGWGKRLAHGILLEYRQRK